MAHNQQGGRPPVKAASAIGQYVAVTFLAGASSVSETVQRTGSINELPFGVTIATVASPGDPVSMAVPGEVVKMTAAASLGAGALVAVGTTTGRVIPLLASGLSTALGSAVGAAGLRWAVGIAMKNAAEGDLFPVFIKPDQIV